MHVFVSFSCAFFFLTVVTSVPKGVYRERKHFATLRKFYICIFLMKSSFHENNKIESLIKC